MAELLIENGTIVNEGECRTGWIRISGNTIISVGEGIYRDGFNGTRIDASGKLVMPGVIDDQVHFREPGLTYKADIATESFAAVAGGVTSFMEMPNTKPPTTDLHELEWKFERAAACSPANFSFYLGATNDNIDQIRSVDSRTVCGVKLFMGSSTGNMLVDSEYALSAVFAESPVVITTHCEDERIIKENTAKYRARYPDHAPPAIHPLIRTAESCYRSTARAVELADKYGSQLHVLHLSTERELSLFDAKPLGEKKITNEVCVHHLYFSDEDYARYGNRIKWNPAIKSIGDRDALRRGVISGKVDVVATDHAPHTAQEKSQGYWDCPSGGPLIQHSLPAMLEIERQGVITLKTLVDKMCHAPATRFAVKKRGFIREGYYADIVIVERNNPWQVEKDNILSKCGWSPFEGHEFSDKVEYTIVNGNIVYDKGRIDDSTKGKPLEFER